MFAFKKRSMTEESMAAVDEEIMLMNQSSEIESQLAKTVDFYEDTKQNLDQWDQKFDQWDQKFDLILKLLRDLNGSNESETIAYEIHKGDEKLVIDELPKSHEINSTNAGFLFEEMLESTVEDLESNHEKLAFVEKPACGELLVSQVVVSNASGFVFDGKKVIGAEEHKVFDEMPKMVSVKENEANGFSCVGETPTVVDICYDIRFQELSRLYAARGAHLLCYSGAFNMIIGPLLWELLQRAMAMDNQLYVATCSPAQDPGVGYIAWSHSTLVGPFGEILATTEHEESNGIEERSTSMIARKLGVFDFGAICWSKPATNFGKFLMFNYDPGGDWNAKKDWGVTHNLSTSFNILSHCIKRSKRTTVLAHFQFSMFLSHNYLYPFFLLFPWPVDVSQDMIFEVLMWLLQCFKVGSVLPGLVLCDCHFEMVDDALEYIFLDPGNYQFWSYWLVIINMFIGVIGVLARCAVILNLSELASITYLELADICINVGLPHGVLNS